MKRLIFFLIFSTLLLKGKAQLNEYPNPLSNQATISYTVASSDTVTLKVYSVTGQVKATIINSSLVAIGTYTMNYTPTGWADGIYMFILSVGSNHFTKKVVYQAAVGINQITKNTKQSFIYPNPAKNLLNINYNGFKKIEILDLNGKIIKSISTSDKTISVSDINTGEYIINIYSGENKLITTEKLLKE